MSGDGDELMYILYYYYYYYYSGSLTERRDIFLFV